MQLYDAPVNSIIRVKEVPGIPPAATSVSKDEVLKYYYIDGMYGKCKNQKGDTVYVKAWTEVEVLDKEERMC